MATELLKTKTYRKLKECMEDACEGVNAIVYGPPSSEKSFSLKYLCRVLALSGRPTIYVYCGPRCTERHMWLSVAGAAGIAIRSSLRWACRHAVLTAIQKMAVLPVIVFDEAQHLDVDALEGVRELHDLTERDDRKGCGVILAGSHRLLAEFLHPQRRGRLEQMLSRFPRRLQLDGMAKEEILTLAAKAFGNGKRAELTEPQKKALLESCSVDDPYFINAAGKPELRTYYSSRRLLEYIRQQKNANAAKPSIDDIQDEEVSHAGISAVN